MYKKVTTNIPLILIFAAFLFFAKPWILSGHAPFPSKHLVNNFNPWSTNPDFFSPVKNNAMPDIITQIYPWRHYSIEELKKGNLPLWNPYTFTGTPHLANYQSATFFPLNIVFFLFPFRDAWSILVLLQPLLAGAGTYYFMRTLSSSREAAGISALSFMFCGFITVWMGYATLPYAILFLPLALASLNKISTSAHWKHFLILSLTVLFSLTAGHFQTAIYFLIAVASYTVFVFWNQGKLLLKVLLTITSGILFSMPQVLPTFELYLQSPRSDSFQTLETIPWSYVPSLIAPDFFGNPVTRNDHFGHYAEWSFFIGTVSLLLAFFVIFKRKKNSYELFFTIMAFIALLFAYNSPLSPLPSSLKIPVLGTSAASRIIVLSSFSFAVLAGFGYDKITKSLKNFDILKYILISCVFVGVLLIFILLQSGENQQIAIKNSILPVFMITSSTVLVLLATWKRKKIFLLTLLILLAFDTSRFAIKWMPFEPKDLIFPDSQTTRRFTEFKDSDRTIIDSTAENTVYYRLSGVSGYDPLYPATTAELIRFAEEGVYKKPERSVINFPKRGKHTDKAINIIGVNFIVHKKSDLNMPWGFPFTNYPPDHFTKIYEDNSYEIYENKKSFPRAYVTTEYKVVKQENQIESIYKSKSEDLKNVSILSHQPTFKSKKSSSTSATIKEYSPNKIILEANSDSPGLLVLLDTFYPGWKAKVNNRKNEILRVNHNFRGVEIQKGKSEIIFTYNPPSLQYGLLLAGFGIIVLSGVLFIRR